MSEIQYDLSGKSNLSFHVGADILNLLLSNTDLIFSMCNKYLNQLAQCFY